MCELHDQELKSAVNNNSSNGKKEALMQSQELVLSVAVTIGSCAVQAHVLCYMLHSGNTC